MDTNRIAGVLLAGVCLSLSVGPAIRLCAAADEAGWNWSDTEARRAQSLARMVRRGNDGYWTYARGEWSVRCNRSAELTAETACYLEMMLKAFDRVFGVTVPTPSARFALTVHDTRDQLAGADGDGEDGVYSVSPHDGGFLLAEVQLAARPRGAPEDSPRLDEQLDLYALQSVSARALLKLCTGARPVPPFLREGCAAYFGTWDVREQKTPGGESRMARIGRRELLQALQKAVMADERFRPGLFERLHASESAFGDGDRDLGVALAASFIDYVLSSSHRRSLPRAMLGKIAQAPATAGEGAAAGLLEPAAAAALEADWRRHICHIVSYSLPVVQCDIPVDGSPPGAPSPSGHSNYGQTPQVAVMAAAKGAFCVAYYDRGGRTIRVLECDENNQRTGECGAAFIDDACNLLGCARIPRDGSYVVGFARDNASGDKAFEYWLARFDRTGKKLFETRIFGEKSSQEMWSKGGPGGAGTARIAYNPETDKLGFYCSHSMKWAPDGVRHQGGYVGFMTLDGKQLMQGDKPVGDGWFFSHNFDQRLIVVNGYYYALAHGDAYPRALGFSKWTDGAGGKTRLAAQNYHAIPGNTGDNTTHCQTGGLVPLPDNKRFAVVFATANERPGYDVCIKVLDDGGTTQREKWLTSYGAERSAAYPRIARYGEDVLVMWEQVEGRASVAQLTVLDEDLDTIVPAGPVADVHVSACYDTINLEDGAVLWATAAGNAIRVYRIDTPRVLEAKLVARMASRDAKAATTKRVPKAGAVESIDRKMIAKLAGLPTAGGDVLKGALRISRSRAPVRLVGAGADGALTFAADGAPDKRATFAYGELPLADRAALAVGLARLEPANGALYGVAGFYLDCAGERTAARECYLKAGRQIADTFDGLFEAADGEP